MTAAGETIVHGTRPFTFGGTISDDPAALLAAAGDAVFVVGAGGSASRLVRESRSAAATAVDVEGRPDATVLADLVERLRTSPSNRIVGVGPGAVIDVVKLAAFHAGRGTESEARNSAGVGHPDVVVAPVGREPYRAVTPFAVVDTDGERPTTVDPSIASADVLVLDELLDVVDDGIRALIAADTAVMACESVFSARSSGISRALATAALDGVGAWLEARGAGRAGSGRGEGLTAFRQLLAASFLVAEAMMTTRLGLGHAVASPLGTVTGMTHDAINAVLGPWVIRRWSDQASSIGAIGRALRVAPTAAAVAGVLDELRGMAGLPATLRELNISWDSVLEALPTSARSSGLPLLPAPVTPAHLEDFARTAWSGAPAAEREESSRAST